MFFMVQNFKLAASMHAEAGAKRKIGPIHFLVLAPLTPFFEQFKVKLLEAAPVAFMG